MHEEMIDFKKSTKEFEECVNSLYKEQDQAEAEVSKLREECRTLKEKEEAQSDRAAGPNDQSLLRELETYQQQLEHMKKENIGYTKKIEEYMNANTEEQNRTWNKERELKENHERFSREIGKTREDRNRFEVQLQEALRKLEVESENLHLARADNIAKDVELENLRTELMSLKSAANVVGKDLMDSANIGPKPNEEVTEIKTPGAIAMEAEYTHQRGRSPSPKIILAATTTTSTPGLSLQAPSAASAPTKSGTPLSAKTPSVAGASSTKAPGAKLNAFQTFFAKRSAEGKNLDETFEGMQ